MYDFKKGQNSASGLRTINLIQIEISFHLILE